MIAEATLGQQLSVSLALILMLQLRDISIINATVPPLLVVGLC